MKFLKILLLVFLLKLIVTTVFVVPNELRSSNFIEFFLTIIVWVIYFVLYYVCRKKIAQKLDLKSIIFNIYLFTSWAIITIANWYVILMLVDIGVLRGAGGWFSGLEYFFMGILHLFYAAGILVLNVTIWGFNKIKNRNSTE